jgi:hypothetical protein
MRWGWWCVAPVAMLAAVCGATAAQAQNLRNIPAAAGESYASATPDDVARAQNEQPDAGNIATTPTVEPLDDATLAKILDQVLNSEPASLGGASKAIRRPASSSPGLNWTRSDGADGAAAYSVSKPLAAPWDAKIGADFNLAPSAPVTYEPLKPLPGSVNSTGAGSAWANVDVPYVASVGVRAEPYADRSRFGSSVQRSVPLGHSLSVSVQGSLAVTELYAPAHSLGTQATAPLTSAPVTSQIWDTDNSVKLSFARTGTAFSVGATTSSIDPLTHSRLTAEQNVYGPLNITGSLYDVGKPTSSQSIGAGLKFDW